MSSLHSSTIRRTSALAAALTLVACSPDAVSSPLAPPTQARAAMDVALPFRGTLESVQTSATLIGPTTLLGHSEGSGNATQLGRYTDASDATIDLQTNMGTEQETLTAANGDLLFVYTTAQATPIGNGETLSVVESSTITGGTGRFEGASGSYIRRCVVVAATGASTGTFDGTITLAR